MWRGAWGILHGEDKVSRLERGVALCNNLSLTLQPLSLQKVLQMQKTKDSGQLSPEAQAAEEALRSFLDPSRGGYSWLDARADMERMMGTLGLVIEVRNSQ